MYFQASDIDEGYNASIYYSTDSDYFYVHPITGVVYPTGEVFESSELTFTVSATDRNGTGRTTQTNITVCNTIIYLMITALRFSGLLWLYLPYSTPKNCFKITEPFEFKCTPEENAKTKLLKIIKLYFENFGTRIDF